MYNNNVNPRIIIIIYIFKFKYLLENQPFPKKQCDTIFF